MNRISFEEVEDRKFLHELATPLSILKLHLLRLVKIHEDGGAVKDLETQKKIMQQMVEAVEKMEKLHANHKSALQSRYTP